MTKFSTFGVRTLVEILTCALVALVLTASPTISSPTPRVRAPRVVELFGWILQSGSRTLIRVIVAEPRITCGVGESALLQCGDDSLLLQALQQCEGVGVLRSVQLHQQRGVGERQQLQQLLLLNGPWWIEAHQGGRGHERPWLILKSTTHVHWIGH